MILSGSKRSATCRANRRISARGISAPRASGVLLGAVTYGTLYTATWTFLLHAPPAGLVAMLVIALGTWRSCR